MSEIRYKPDRRADLLVSARAILAEKGLEATTISEIVARAGVAQGTFYLYFPSKMAILAALNAELNEHILSAVREATAQATSAAKVVQAGVSAAFQELERYRDVLHVIHSRMSANPTLDDWEEQFGPYRKLIIELIQQLQATSEIDETINPDIWARLIIGLINHAADECYIYHVQVQPHVYIAEVIRFISRALGLSA
ncbi:MAG: TetR/AcrR family transcriptional regulator [Ktedonobacteraceae bacterium]